MGPYSEASATESGTLCLEEDSTVLTAVSNVCGLQRTCASLKIGGLSCVCTRRGHRHLSCHWT